jgi:hypothetical protein
VLSIVLPSLAPGCALVEKAGADGAVERSVALLSPVSVVGASPGSSNAVRVTGLGLGIGPSASVLGAYDIMVAHLGPECRVVIMPTRQVQLHNLRSLLKEVSDVCIVDG